MAQTNADETSSSDKASAIPDLGITTVYADKLHKDWFYTDGSIQISDASYLTNTGIFNETELYETVGGFLGNPTSGQFSLRGLNNDNLLGYFGTRSNNIITTAVHGIPLSASVNRYFPRFLWETQEVVVVKGGQSTNYGTNSMGGLIYFTGKQPEFNFNGEANLQFANAKATQFSIAQNLKLSDTHALRLNYQHSQSDGHITNSTLRLDDWEKTDRKSFKFQHLWKSNDSQLLTTIEFEDSNSNPFTYVNESGGSTIQNRTSIENTRTLYDANRWLVGSKYEKRLSNEIRLENNISFSSFASDGIIDLDLGPLLNWHALSSIDEKIFINDFLVTGKKENALWSAGIHLNKSEFSSDFQGSAFVTPAGIPFDTSVKESVEIIAIFGKYEHQFNQNWSLTGGLRINHDERETTSFGNTAISPTNRSGDTVSATDLLPSLNLAWKSSDEEYLIGLKASRNYRAGGLSIAPTQGITRSFAAEYSNDFEIYLRSNSESELNWSLSLFYSDMEDLQVPVSVPTGLPSIDTLVDNSGEAHRYGAEMQLIWKPTSHFTTDLSLNFTKTQFDELSLNGVNYEGQSFPNAPELSGSIGISYLQQKGLYGSCRLSWSDTTHSFANAPQTTGLEKRLNLSANLGYAFENWKIYAYADNILNESYALGRTDATALGAGIFAKPNNPRTYGIGLSHQW